MLVPLKPPPYTRLQTKMARRDRTRNAGLAGVALLAATSAIGASAFSIQPNAVSTGLANSRTRRPHLSSPLYLEARGDSDDISETQVSAGHAVRNIVAAAALASAIALPFTASRCSCVISSCTFWCALIQRMSAKGCATPSVRRSTLLACVP